MRTRIVIIHMLQVPLVIYSGYQMEKVCRNAERMHLDDLSDYEIKNFDNLLK